MQTADPVPNQTAERYGEVFDRGYARYNGPRLGRRQAVKSLIGYSMKRAMGIRKSWTAKVLPFLLYVSVVIPVIVMIGVDALVDGFDFTSYTSYIQWTFAVVGVFVAMSAPEMLCVDRKERTLPLYFSRAISRMDYVNAKVIAMTLLTMTMTLVPMVVLWLGQQLSADSVWTAMRDNIGDLGRVVFLGTLISLTLGVLGLMVSSFTDRKGVAITIIFIGFLIVTALAVGSMELLQDEYDWAKYLVLLSLTDVFIAISGKLFNDVQFVNDNTDDLSLQVYVGYTIALIVLGLLVLRWRYSPRDDA